MVIVIDKYMHKFQNKKCINNINTLYPPSPLTQTSTLTHNHTVGKYHLAIYYCTPLAPVDVIQQQL